MIYIHNRRVKPRTSVKTKAPVTYVRKGVEPPPVTTTFSAWDSSWEEGAKSSVEEIINQFVLEFIDFPYLHRSESSLHCELYKELSNSKLLERTYPLGKWSIQPVQKDWPEYYRRPGHHRMGTIDVCVLSPEEFKVCSLEDFKEGKINPLIAIEVVLDSDLSQLMQDSQKLLAGGNYDYLIYLVRPGIGINFSAAEDFLLNCGFKTAYARLTDNQAFYKLINDQEIKTTKLP